MSKFAKVAIGTAGALLVALIAAGLFLRHLVVKSFPVTTGELLIPGLEAPVDVVRDDYGVPHIRASSEHDLMEAAGYVHAQDRLWQMDIIRRAGEGRLSEVLGKQTLEYDKLFRTLNLRAVADSIRSRLHPETERALEAYAAGVNAYIADHRGRYPVEFDMLNYAPEPWRVEESILAGRLVAWELNLAWWTDITYGEIAAHVDAKKFAQLIPTYPDSIQPAAYSPAAGPAKRLAAASGFLDVGRSYRRFFGLGSLEAGSNAWVVGGSKSLSGKPILANDPHLAMPAPSRWYEMHLTAPGWNVAGVSIPGTPFIVIGRNDSLAWGLTNAMLDDADFYLEKIDSTGTYAYLNARLPVRTREEKILIGRDDSTTITVRSTLHGPIVSDVHPSHDYRGTGPDSGALPVSMRWSGLDASEELYGFHMMNKARGLTEFERGLREIGVPGQTVLYADEEGNIAAWTTGRVPIRSGKSLPMIPQQGWTGEGEWKGYVPFDELPHALNPRDGVLASANQQIAGRNFPYYLSTLWEPPSRIVRIRQLLASAEKFSPADFRQFQQDVLSPFARDVVGRLIAAFDSTQAREPDAAPALDYLHNWDFRFTQSDIATTIFNAFFVRLLHNTYEDEMGEGLFRDFVFFGAIPYRVTEQLLAADSSSWFDDVRTPQVETKNEILRKSLAEAVVELRAQLGSEMKLWRWGNVHTVTFKHLFGSRKPLDKVFNVGPFPIAGGGTTVAKTEYRMMLPYETSVGPSMRQVVDMASPSSFSIVITSGESGQPLEKHYDDQTPLWLNGGYLELSTDWRRIDAARGEKLRLVPAK